MTLSAKPRHHPSLCSWNDGRDLPLFTRSPRILNLGSTAFSWVSNFQDSRPAVSTSAIAHAIRAVENSAELRRLGAARHQDCVRGWDIATFDLRVASCVCGLGSYGRIPSKTEIALQASPEQMVLHVAKPSDPTGAILEAWAEGYMVGSLVIMACVTFANMRKHVLLHKLILLELFLGMLHGTFIFTSPPVYNWYLSATAILLNISWSLHNVIAWIKNKPFLPRWGSILYISTVVIAQPYWVVEIVANFLYFSDKSSLFMKTRPYEALFRDPWWIFTVLSLFYNIKSRYEFSYTELIRVSPRFGVLLFAMIMSICFIILDILSVTKALNGPGLPDGINPFWKLAFVFKCLTDTIILDDFKTALDKLKAYRMQNMNSVLSDGVRGDFSDVEQAKRKKSEKIDLDISNPDEFRTSGMAPPARDWTKINAAGCDHLDLEAALRSIEPEGESSNSSKSKWIGG